MKKTILIILFIAAYGLVNAQNCNGKNKMRKRFEAQKMAYITQELDLTPEESQKFWPLYNEMSKKLFEARAKRYRNKKGEETIAKTDDEILKRCDEMLQAEINMALIKKEYFNKFKDFLSPKKVYRMLTVERDFKRKLLGKLGCRNGQGAGQGNREHGSGRR